eukprot:COSAG02_NODE_36568_length_453_cov_0.725989_2_plen_27_part_01
MPGPRAHHHISLAVALLVVVSAVLSSM